jgi:hypothetical protein
MGAKSDTHGGKCHTHGRIGFNIHGGKGLEPSLRSSFPAETILVVFGKVCAKPGSVSYRASRPRYGLDFAALHASVNRLVGAQYAPAATLLFLSRGH